jgi:hypothetical protein
MKKIPIGNCELYHGDCFHVLSQLSVIAGNTATNAEKTATACNKNMENAGQ